jgi:hypothetical protein
MKELGEINAVIMFVISLGNLYLIVTYLKENWKLALFHLINSYILILYISGLLGRLNLGVTLIYMVGGLGLGRIAFDKIYLKKIFGLSLLDVVWFIPFLIFIRSVPSDFKFITFDEFPNWALYIKFLTIEQTLAGLDSSTRFVNEGFNQAYPPAQLLFQYLWVNLLPWNESYVLSAQIILSLAILITISSFIGAQSRFWQFIVFFNLLSLQYYIGIEFNNILADGFLALHFTATVLLACNIGLSSRKIALVSLALFVLVLIKPISFVFSLLPIMILVSRIIRAETKTLISFGRSPKISRSFVSNVLVLLAGPLVGIVSWRIHVNSLSLSSNINSLSLKSGSLRETSFDFANFFFSEIYGADNLAGNTTDLPSVFNKFNVSLFLIYVFSIFVCLIMIRFITDLDQSALKMTVTNIVVFTIIFQLILVFLYTYIFGEVVAVIRYSIPIIFLWLTLSGLLLFLSFTSYLHARFFKILGFALTLLVLPSQLALDMTQIRSDPDKLRVRNSVEQIASDVEKIVKTDEKVYLVYQGSDGFEKYIFSYLILPIRTNDQCWNLAVQGGSLDRWTCSTAFPSVLTGYDYLFLANSDSDFWKTYSQYFAGDEKDFYDGLFKISSAGDDITLSKVKL